MPTTVPRIGGVHLDGMTLIAAIVISAATIVLFALAPALSMSSGDLQTYMRSGSRSLASSKRSRTWRHALVIAQVALTVVVLSGAGLLGRTLERLQRLHLGFDAERVGIIEMRTAESPKNTAGTLNDLIERAANRASAVPGVTGVAAAIQPPFTSGGIDGWVSAEDETVTQHASDPFVDLEFVTPNYFQVLGIRVLRGRAFDATDAGAKAPIVVISENVARHYWATSDVVGKRLHCLGGSELCEVVGVVEDTHYRDLVKPQLTVYRPSRQAPAPVFAPRVLLVRASGDVARVLPAVRSAITEGEPSVTLGRVVAMRELLSVPLAQPRLNATLMLVFALSALLLASSGVVGTLAFHVSLRTREIGIRQALGATPRELARMLVLEGLALQSIGIASGFMIALIANQALRSLLFGVTPTDPVSLFGAIGVLAGCGLLAVAFPARQAARVDPCVALRAD